MSEITGKDYRSYYNNMVIAGQGISIIIFFLLFNAGVNWKAIYFGSTLFLLFSNILYYSFTVENFRYYFITKDYTNIVYSAKYIAKFNGLDNSSDFSNEIKKYELLMEKENMNMNIDQVKTRSNTESTSNMCNDNKEVIHILNDEKSKDNNRIDNKDSKDSKDSKEIVNEKTDLNSLVDSEGENESKFY